MKGITCALLCLIVPIAATPAHAGWFGPDNFAECLFENLPGVGSNKAVVTVTAACKRQFPGEPTAGWLDSGNYDRCVTRHMKGIVNDRAALAVEAACRQLYGGPL